MKLLQINIFCTDSKLHRLPFTIKQFEELKKLQHKENICISIHGETNIINSWENYLKLNGTNKLQVQLCQHSTPFYMSKVYSAQASEYTYSCKLDDDVFVPIKVWEYLIDNLHNITKQTPILSPILTNGIPSVEFFIRDFLTIDQQKEATKLLLTTGKIIENQWGLDYSKVNTQISTYTEWPELGYDYWKFMETVDTKWDQNNVPWYYKIVRGVHPARFSEEYNMYVAKAIMSNRDKFFNPVNLALESYDAPYFTNNMFISLTDYWKKTTPLFDDGFDEGQLTLQMDLDKSKILYARNGYGIHMAYGMTANQINIENFYITQL